MNKIIKKYKSKFPVGSIIKVKTGTLLKKVLDYSYMPGARNPNGTIVENYVKLENINYSGVHEIGYKSYYDIDILKFFELYDETKEV